MEPRPDSYVTSATFENVLKWLITTQFLGEISLLVFVWFEFEVFHLLIIFHTISFLPFSLQF